MGQGKSLGKLLIQSQGAGEGAGDLRHLQRMGKTAAKMVTWRIVGQAGEDLGFAGETAKSACVQDARGIPRKRCAIGMRRLRSLRCASSPLSSPRLYSGAALQSILISLTSSIRNRN